MSWAVHLRVWSCSLHTVTERRMLSTFLSVPDHLSHPLHSVLAEQRSIFSLRLIKVKSSTECHRLFKLQNSPLSVMISIALHSTQRSYVSLSYIVIFLYVSVLMELFRFNHCNHPEIYRKQEKPSLSYVNHIRFVNLSKGLEN